ncbi:phage major capsid protein [Bradyrhizobium iriomotense]|uniref:Phage capsid protein n=1 Tax=Bradyrhizobium iriomotense TaxID=441950 RepID=A0ABQ6B0Y2_9BRAD|nr:phage major capsid protein [Bradyrhizobium iriomotense]GLR85838.1 phage capsid protein [Bradyrhizobium iriomotense]
MTDQSGIQDLLAEIKAARESLKDAPSAKKFAALETSVNDIIRRISRPGALDAADLALERKHATDYLTARHVLKVGASPLPPEFGGQEIEQAIAARKAFRSFLRFGDFQRMLDPERKALSEFALGQFGVLVPPQISDRILSCLTDPGDLAGIVDNLTISGASIQFLIDNADFEDLFGWACEAECAANGTGADAAKGLGQLELRPEELRGLICATRSFLDDAAIDIESWISRKAQAGVRKIASRAIASGSGNGMPIGILNPMAGIPICDTGVDTPAGTFTWQDLVMLMFQVPIAYHAGATWVANQRTLGLLFSMSDAAGRPIVQQDLQAAPRFTLLGHPIVVSEFWPDVAPGATPLAFGNFREAYMLINRRALTILPDQYSAGFCILYKLFARLGGGIICPDALRLLRVR